MSYQRLKFPTIIAIPLENSPALAFKESVGDPDPQRRMRNFLRDPGPELEARDPDPAPELELILNKNHFNNYR
jgi:hypothetical protein